MNQPFIRDFFSIRWRLFLFVWILFFSFLLTACSGIRITPVSQGSGTFSAANGCKDVAILLPEAGTASRWEERDRPLLEQEIAQRLPGVTLRYFFAKGRDDAKNQEKQAELALNRGACILIVGASDSKEASGIVKKAKAKGVPVIAYDRLIDDKDLAFYISFDGRKVGELQGQYIVDEFNKGLKGAYKLQKGDNLVMIHGDGNDNNAQLFRQGVLSKLQPLIDIKYLNLVSPDNIYIPNWSRTESVAKMKELLDRSNNNIKIAYIANDGMAISIIDEVLKPRNLDGKVLVTGQDGTTQSIENIIRGSQAMTVYKPSQDIAIKTAEIVAALSNGININPLKNDITPTTDGGQVPSFLVEPLPVDKTNIMDTVCRDGFIKKELCR